MKLILTYYVDKSPEAVKLHLDRAVRIGIDATADLESPEATESDARAELVSDGAKIRGGSAGLDGSEVHITGTDLLSTVRFVVPWQDDDAGSPKLRAASRFAATVADEVLAAA